MSAGVKRGDRFTHRHPEDRSPLFIEVTRVGREGWVDIRCSTWAMTWTKRMPHGLGQMLDEGAAYHIEREDWTIEDVISSKPSDAEAVA